MQEIFPSLQCLMGVHWVLNWNAAKEVEDDWNDEY